MKFYEKDLPVFFGEFGEPAVFNPDSETPLECTVIVDDGESDPSLFGQPTANQFHFLTAQTSDVASIREDDTVDVLGQTFIVDYVYPGVSGLTKMRLK